MVVIIKMKGLPWEATAREIRQFYRGLEISEDDIHLAPSQEGKASGFAFACFKKDDEARKAMYRNGNYVGKRYIELVLSSQSEMDKILSEGVRFRRFEGERPPMKDIKSQTEIKLRSNGVKESSRSSRDTPRRSRSRSPIRKNSSVDGSKSQRDHGASNHVNERREAKKFSERSSLRIVNGRGVNGLSTKRDEQDRRGRDKEKRRDLVKNVNRRRSRSYTKDREGKGTRRETSFANGTREVTNGFISIPMSRLNQGRHDSTSRDGLKSTWVHITSLPYSVTEDEIVQFFSGLNVLHVHLMSHASGPYAGKNNGEAYVEFRTVGDRIQGEDRNRQFIKSRFVGVRQCSVEDVLAALENRDAWTLQEPAVARPSFSPESTMYSVGNLNRKSQNLSAADMGMANVVMNSPGKIPVPTNEVGGMEGQVNPLNQLAAGANISMNDIQAGCVIGMRNLPSTVSAEEILDFFYGFPIIPDSIRIHYLAPGRSSGDAMVTLPTRGEAHSAIKQLNNKPVGKRKVQLFLV